MSIATTSDLAHSPTNPLIIRLAAAAGCVALADWLFYRQDVGISLALFLGIFGIVAVATNRTAVSRRVQVGMTVVFIAALLAVVENISEVSGIISLLSTALFVIVMTKREASSWQRDFREAVTAPFRGPFQLASDLFGALRHVRNRTPGWQGSLIAWIVPLGLFVIFLALFASANPVIESRLLQTHLDDLLRHIDGWRIWFWVWTICLFWPLIHRRIRRKAETKAAIEIRDSAGQDHLLGVKAVSRALVLFNLLFGMQSGLDLMYLWGGAALPNGISYAEYAHQGAYPLIVTALLAAGFVLVAMRPGGPAEKSRLIRPLVVVWIAQNILLVVSSIFRLDLYVAAYSLTYLRLAAFIWMGLVATGLVLILIQIELKKSNSWLLSANAIALALALYACCFINAPSLIASYNVAHSREIGGAGPTLDVRYLESLGPQAEPALRPYLVKMPALDAVINQCRNYNYVRERDSWRGWTFRTWRLARYLANNPYTPKNPDDSGKG